MLVLPLPVLRRLPTYLLLLEDDKRKGSQFVSSTDWAVRLGATSIQVRKDLAATGAVGVPKKGFPLHCLEEKIRVCLGTDNRRDVFLIGLSALGRGVASHPTLGQHGFSIVGVFDPTSRGPTTWADKPALAWEKFPDLVRRMGVSVVLLAVESSQAQRITEKVVAAGVQTIWNLTGKNLKVPPGVSVLDEDLGARLATLIRTDG